MEGVYPDASGRAGHHRRLRGRGLDAGRWVTYYGLFFFSLGSRKVHVVGRDAVSSASLDGAGGAERHEG